MGLTASAMKVLSNHIRGKKILSLGYPDLLMTKEQVRKTLEVTPTKFTDFGLWHGATEKLPETLHVFELLGSTLDCVDVHASRGCERIVDLNYPNELGKYDVVIDAGTTEHCFNIAQAMLNASEAVKVGGVIFHSPPLTMLNHGFYCVQPTMLHDFYTQNGWKVERMHLYMKGQMFDPCPTTERFECPAETSVYFLARRITEHKMAYPTQAKYVKSPDLRVA